jgi:hypothetical protein
MPRGTRLCKHPRVRHEWYLGQCVHCGASQRQVRRWQTSGKKPARRKENRE